MFFVIGFRVPFTRRFVAERDDLHWTNLAHFLYSVDLKKRSYNKNIDQLQQFKAKKNMHPL